MTSDYSAPPYQPPFAQDLNVGLQVFASPLDATPTQPLTPPQFRATLVAYPRGHELWQKVIECEIRVSDSRGGYAQYGRYDRIPNGFASATGVDPRFVDHLMASPSFTQQVFATANGSFGGVYYTEVFGQTVIGTGNVANEALFIETSASNPALQKLNYTPTGYIDALAPILQNSPTKNERLCVMRTGQVPQILSDLAVPTPTVDSSMNAALTGAYGLISSTVNATTPGTVTNLFGVNSGTAATSGIWALPSTAADNALPTQVLFGLPGIGWAMGTEKLVYDMDMRAFWAFAGDSSSTFFNVVHTNIEGSDPIRVPFNNLQGKLRRAWLWRRQVVATDGVNIMAFDGRNTRDLGFGNYRTMNSDRHWAILDGWTNNNDMGVLAVDTDGSATATTAAQTVRLEQYLPETNAWLPISEVLDINQVGVALDSTPLTVPVLAGPHIPTIPWSRRSGFMQIHMLPSGSADTWDRLFMASSRKNPFYLYNQTGTAAGFSKPFATSGTITRPIWALPPALGYSSISRFPCVLAEIDMSENNLAAGAKSGGTPSSSTFKVEVAVQSRSGSSLTFTGAQQATFNGSNPIAAKRKRFNDLAPFNWLQLRETLTRDAGSANSTPNGYPYTVRFLAFTDGKARRPAEIGGDLSGTYGDQWRTLL